jgi:catechol 2,3-dioxygenase-like lactoylglutathione lyase family enzyme
MSTAAREDPGMLELDHLRLPVTDMDRSRSWYVSTLGLRVEFEVPDRRTVALQDTAGFTLFLQQVPAAVAANGCALWFQVADVDATVAEWSARGVRFAHGPEQTYWGYGAELRDPDGYLVRLWDERSMRER